MTTFRVIPLAILLTSLSVDAVLGQRANDNGVSQTPDQIISKVSGHGHETSAQIVSKMTSLNVRLGQNAALRYWSAFAEMQDSIITDQQAEELNLILEGTAPYDHLKYKDLVEKNRPALETMARGTAIHHCDWGLDYELGPKTPVDFVRKALSLGRLNVLYAFHLAIAGDKDGAVHALSAGLRFSRDVANGGTLFATFVAKHLLADHLRVATHLLHVEGLSPAQRLVLRQAIEQLGPEGLDWRGNVKRELEISYGLDSQASAALAHIIPAYVGTLDKPSTLPEVQQMIASTPSSLREVIPNPKKVIEAKQELTEKISQTRSMLE